MEGNNVIIIIKSCYVHCKGERMHLGIEADPTNTIITFDIHGVLFTTDYKKIITKLWKERRIFIRFFRPSLLFGSIRFLLYSRDKVGESLIMDLAAKHQLVKEHLPLIINILNTQKPIQSTIDTIKQLKLHGYSLHILSNIGEYLFSDLKKLFPALFSLFDSCKVASQDKGYIGKPDQRMFKQYLNEYNHTNKQIVFVDDKQRNINAAETAGMIGICYRSGKQLAKELKTLNILTV